MKRDSKSLEVSILPISTRYSEALTTSLPAESRKIDVISLPVCLDVQNRTEANLLIMCLNTQELIYFIKLW